MKKLQHVGPELFGTDAAKQPKPKAAPVIPLGNKIAKAHGEIAGLPTSLERARFYLGMAAARCNDAITYKVLTDSQCERLLAIAAESEKVLETLTNLQREADGMKDVIHGSAAEESGLL